MFYHINAFRQTDKKKYQLDFGLEGDFDDIKERLESKAIITLSINSINEDELDSIGTIKAQIYHQKTNRTHQLITHHDKVAQACLLLMFLGFEVREITDTANPLSPAQSNQLIALVQSKINGAQQRKKETKAQKIGNHEFDNEKLKKLKEIAQKTQNEAQSLITSHQDTLTPLTLKPLQNTISDLQKYARGTNANKIALALKKTFEIMEELELQLIDNSKQNEIKVIKESLVSNVDIVSEYSKRQTASNIQKVGEKSTDSDDKFYMFFGKIGMYQRFLSKDFFYKIGQGNYLTQTFVNIVTIIMYLVPASIGIRRLIDGVLSTTYNNNLLSQLSALAVYPVLRAITSKLLSHQSTRHALSIVVVISLGYIFSLLLTNTFAL